MPPTDDVESAVEQIMAPFDENGPDDEEKSSRTFWDWYVIGGRWSGYRLTSALSKPAVDAFYDKIKAAKITVSGVRAGKPTISPSSQIDVVDALWRESFPEFPGDSCPFFDHYQEKSVDIYKFCEVVPEMECEHLIVASPNYRGDSLEAKFMVIRKVFNGVIYQKTDWNGKIGSALDAFEAYFKGYKEEYVDKMRPRPDWVCVTVDYHS